MNKFEIRCSTEEPSSSSYPVAPCISIAVNQHVLSARNGSLTPDLMTDREIDEAINQLVGDLEQLRDAAKKTLESARSRSLR